MEYKLMTKSEKPCKIFYIAIGYLVENMKGVKI
jgi:hypothetical protein